MLSKPKVADAVPDVHGYVSDRVFDGGRTIKGPDASDHIQRAKIALAFVKSPEKKRGKRGFLRALVSSLAHAYASRSHSFARKKREAFRLRRKRI